MIVFGTTGIFNDGLEKRFGKTRYELGLYKNNKLIQIFGTDAEYCIDILAGQAESYAKYLSKTNGRADYHLKNHTGKTTKSKTFK